MQPIELTPEIMADLAACALPDTVQEMIRVMGLEAALTLINKAGGTRWSMPKHQPPQKLLERTPAEIHRQILLLAQHHAGERLAIPRMDRALRCIRDQDLIRRYSAGDSINDLARLYGITYRTVEKALQNPTPLPEDQPGGGAQGTLF
ncbi:Mor transcription activator family protein [Magnetococcus sp. PR-3]|uniref:Mor transcription activator family protein n=1 Tax=Magnetococcus sp. PR-3 TaxID=3120355 RepID=UPI002FCE5AB4